MDTENQIFLIMKDEEYQYCLYRLDESQTAPQNSDDELVVGKLEKPLLKMDKLTFPDRMSFVAVGSRIYMVGGLSRDGDNQIYVSKTFIFDTLSESVVSGPSLVSGKSKPNLLTLGSKIFALSRFILRCGSVNFNVDPKPQFEVLETKDIDRGWLELPAPEFISQRGGELWSVDACVATYVGDGTSGAIFISVRDGTYAFDVDKKMWNHVSDEKLPFRGRAKSIPPSSDLPVAPTLCCASSTKFKRLSVFRFLYYANEGDKNKSVFEFDEIEIEKSFPQSPPLLPSLFDVHALTVFGPAGRAYCVMCGVDEPHSRNTFIGNCYVKITAMEVPIDKLSNAPLLKSCKKKKTEMESEEDFTAALHSNKGQVLKRCKKQKRQIGHDEVEDETATLNSNQGQLLKRCRNKKREMTKDEERDQVVKIKMTQIWRRSFLTGPICDILEPISAAIPM